MYRFHALRRVAPVRRSPRHARAQRQYNPAPESASSLNHLHRSPAFCTIATLLLPLSSSPRHARPGWTARARAQQECLFPPAFAIILHDKMAHPDGKAPTSRFRLPGHGRVQRVDFLFALHAPAMNPPTARSANGAKARALSAIGDARHPEASYGENAHTKLCRI